MNDQVSQAFAFAALEAIQGWRLGQVPTSAPGCDQNAPSDRRLSSDADRGPITGITPRCLNDAAVTGTHACPTCAHEIVWDWTCHTWFNGTTWMSCLGCDSAVSFRCNNDDYCPWEYTWGLNAHNPRDAANQANRPAWLTGDPEWDPHRYSVTNMPAGVRSWDEANQ